MNDLFEIVEDLKAIDAKMEALQEVLDKWAARVEEAEAELEEICQNI